MKTNKTIRPALLAVIITIIISLTACDAFLVLTEEEFFVEKYNIETNSISPATKSVTYSQSSLLKWPPVAAAVSYDLQLSSNEDFSGTFIEDISNLKTSEYQTANLPAYGRYFWRVRAYLNDGNISPWFEYAFSYLSSDLFEHFEQFTEGGFSTLRDWTLSDDYLPVIQDKVAADGFYAAGLGSENKSGNSLMSVEIESATSKILSFKYMKADNDSSFSFYVNSDRKINLDDATDGWIQYSTLLSPGSHTLKWTEYFYNYSYFSTETDSEASDFLLYIDSIQLNEVPEFVNDGFETVDGSFSTLNDWELSGDVLPHIQSNRAYEGTNAVQLDVVESYDNSTFKVIVDVKKESTISFHALKNNSSGDLKFYVDNSSKLWTSSEISVWTAYEYRLSPGVHTLKWDYVGYSSNETGSVWIDSIKITEVPAFVDDGFETVDGSFSTLNDWELSGDVLPAIQSTESHEGSNAVRFGDVGSYDNSSFETVVNVAEDSTISFYALKDNNIGNLSFEVDGYSKFSTQSALSPWTRYSYSLSAGVHSLKWHYKKYSSSTVENVYIDTIKISN